MRDKILQCFLVLILIIELTMVDFIVLGNGIVLALQDNYEKQNDAKLEISNNQLSTLQINENVQMLITLKSDAEKYDLYKNPTVEIILPKELIIKVKKIEQVNMQDMFNIVEPRLHISEDGSTIISMKLKGEQTSYASKIDEGIQIVLIGDIEIDKKTPTKESEIVMNYTNENRPNEIFTKKAPIYLNSKYGLLIYNKLSNYNNRQDIVESIDNKVNIANLDTNNEEIQANEEISIINNYEESITDVSIIGRITKENETSFEPKLVEKINIGDRSGKIYYSEDENAQQDSNTWAENVEDINKIKAFKVTLDDNEISSGETLNLSNKIGIKENLETNQTAYTNLEISYSYLGVSASTNSTIQLSTQATNYSEQNKQINSNIETKQIGNLKIEVNGTTGSNNLEIGEDVLEGQIIKYKVKVTNTGDEDITNLKLYSYHENGTFWDSVESKYFNTTTEQIEKTYEYKENIEISSKELIVGELKRNDSREFDYQVTVHKTQSNNSKLIGKIEVKENDLEQGELNLTGNEIKPGKIKVTIYDYTGATQRIRSNSVMKVEIRVQNLSDKKLNNIQVNIPLSSEFSFNPDSIDEGENYEFVSYENNVVTLKINNVDAKTEESIVVVLLTKEIDLAQSQLRTTVTSNVEIEGEKYYSNEMYRTIHQSETQIELNQKSSKEENSYLVDGEEIEFSTEIKNLGAITAYLTVIDEVPDGLTVKEAYILNGENKQEIVISENNYNTLMGKVEIDAYTTATLVIKTQVEKSKLKQYSVENIVTVEGDKIIEKSNSITYMVSDKEKSEIIIYTDKDEQDDPNRKKTSEMDDIVENTTPGADEEDKEKTQEEKEDSSSSKDEKNGDAKGDKISQEEKEENNNIHYIKGVAWIDSNRDGERQENEKRMDNIEVILINSITDEKNSAKTNNNGEYEFNNINKGNYIVAFIYDTSKYGVTEIKKAGVNNSKNSDVIIKNININENETKVAATENLQLNGKNLDNIDAGFVENKTFDLKLNKYINKVIVQNNKGTKLYEYNNTQFAKVEIDAKQLVNSTVIIEYGIQVINEGEIAGYINEIIDYIPNDLVFRSELNKNWYQTTTGELKTKELANEIINPGETKTTTLTLVKTMNQNNTGIITNTAEISSASNDLSIGDIDSTPNNKESNEDDISTAQVIVSIKTGAVTYIILALSIGIIICSGIYLIKLKVLKYDLKGRYLCKRK